MATTRHEIGNVQIISTDWSNFCNSLYSTAQRFDWKGTDISTLADEINKHPASVLISIPFMFSFFKKLSMQKSDCHVQLHAVTAAVTLLEFLDKLAETQVDCLD